MSGLAKAGKNLRYRGEAVLLGCVFFVLGRLTLARAIKTGSALGRTAGRLLRRRSAQAGANIELALPQLKASERREVVRQMWENFGAVAAELAHQMRAHPFPGPGARDFDIVGEENLSAIRSGQQTLFISGHFGAWELLPVMCGKLGFPLHLVYRQANNPATDQMIVDARAPYCLSQIPKGAKGARAIIKAMRDGDPVGMLVDQKLNSGIDVPFFGHSAMTVSAPAELALRFGLHLLPIRSERTNQGRYRLIVDPPLVPNPETDKEQEILRLMTDVNRVLEGWIREKPGNWYWLHKRWK